ncbi:hypothetical protein GCM10009827_078930 [Dactylosporangium maewongense]|uniref:Uncharacterized protein n=1 Tax=Dactylosporangium maewongense TaxID=634393 RepID=A0ABN2BVF4_9ACTN
MYGWIWRHIPFKQWQLKSLVSVILIGALGALLWYKVFPAVEPILPFDDVQVETTDQDGGQLQQPSADPSQRPSTQSSTQPSKQPSKLPTKTPSAPQVLPS